MNRFKGLGLVDHLRAPGPNTGCPVSSQWVPAKAFVEWTKEHWQLRVRYLIKLVQQKRMSRVYIFMYLFWPSRAACGILVSWLGIKPLPPALEAWGLNHWTPREVPSVQFWILCLCFSIHVLLFVPPCCHFSYKMHASQLKPCFPPKMVTNNRLYIKLKKEKKSYLLSLSKNLSTYMTIFCLLFSRWHDIANMSHNKSFFALELANKEETIQFQTVSKH